MGREEKRDERREEVAKLEVVETTFLDTTFLSTTSSSNHLPLTTFLNEEACLSPSTSSKAPKHPPSSQSLIPHHRA